MSMVSEELALLARGYSLIAGVDEVGRGCWGGPVMAAAVVFDPQWFHVPDVLKGITDSKQLSHGRRSAMVAQIEQGPLMELLEPEAEMAA